MASREFMAGRAELDVAGFSDTQIDSWLNRGRLVQILRGVYSLGRDVETREAVFQAALIAAGPGALLAGRSACEVWGMTRPRGRLPHQVDVAVPDGRARKLSGQSHATRHTTVNIVRRQIEPGDVRTRSGLTVASPVFALMDLAVADPAREIHFAFLEACRIGLFRRRDVDDCYHRMTGRRGAKKLRPLMALWVPELARIKSVFEGTVLLAWVPRGWPMPLVNEKVHGYEVDFYWPQFKAILELDGVTYHSDPVQRAIDAAKQRDLEARGLKVLRITSTEFEANPDGHLDRVGLELGLLTA